MTKSAISSVTLWGILLTAFCSYFPGVASALHLTDPATQAAIGAFVGGVGTFVGLALTVYGRLNATQAISGLFKAKPATPAASSPLPPAAANLLLVLFALPIALAIAGGLSGCASTATGTASSTSTPVSISTVLGSVTSAVNAHPAATDQGRQDAEIAFVVSADGLEALYKAGVLKGANLATAKSDLETAYKVIATARLALGLAGATPSAALVSDEAQTDATFSRVDGELVAS